MKDFHSKTTFSISSMPKLLESIEGRLWLIGTMCLIKAMQEHESRSYRRFCVSARLNSVTCLRDFPASGARVLLIDAFHL